MSEEIERLDNPNQEVVQQDHEDETETETDAPATETETEDGGDPPQE